MLLFRPCASVFLLMSLASLSVSSLCSGRTNPHLWQTVSLITDELEPDMSRLTIDVSDQQHQALKALAALEGKSIKQYTLERLFPSDEQQAMQTLKSLLQHRLASSKVGDVSALSATEIAEETLRELGAV